MLVMLLNDEDTVIDKTDLILVLSECPMLDA